MPIRKATPQERLAWVEDFENLANWKRSSKGNLFRHWGGSDLTVFKRGDGLFSWCMSGGFSDDVFETEAEAISNLAHAVGAGMDCDIEE